MNNMICDGDFEGLCWLKADEIDPQLWRIQFFKSRFKELWENWSELKEAGMNWSGNYERPDKKVIKAPPLLVSRHRLKGFYLDFRPFWSNNDNVNFKSILKLLFLSSREDNDNKATLKKYAKDLREQWDGESLLYGWHKYNNDQLLDLWFNGGLFHDDEEKINNLAALKDVMNNDACHLSVSYAVYHRMLVVRSLNWSLLPLRRGFPAIRIPMEHLARVSGSSS